MNAGGRPCFRLTYSKLPPLTTISHKDLIEVLQRTMRRAGLPLAYSQGYSPHPRVSFGPPLPVGVAGLAELADVELSARLHPDEMERRLAKWSPPGLVPRKVEYLLGGAPSINALVGWAEYAFQFERRTLTEEALTGVRRLQEILERGDAAVEKISRKGTRRVLSLRSLVKDLKAAEDGLTAVLACNQECSLNPYDFVRLVFQAARGERGLSITPAAGDGCGMPPARCTRTGFFTCGGLKL